MHMTNQKIRNDHYKFNDMRHKENRTMRHNLDPHLTNRAIRGFMGSTFKSAKGLIGGAKELFGSGKGSGGSGSGSGSGSGGAYSGAGQNGGGAGSGGISDSGSLVNSDIPTASSHESESEGMKSSTLIPIAIGVAVVGYFLFSKK
jgi:hypothetical protein